MIVSIAEWAIRRFEWYNCSPGMVERAAGLLKKLVDTGVDAQVIQKIQILRLSDTISYVYKRSPFYSRMFQRLGMKPEDIRTVDDLNKLPLVVAGDMNLYGHVIADAVAKVSGVTSRIKIELEKNDLTDKMVLLVEGMEVRAEEVRRNLFKAYPELEESTENGNIILEIRTGVDLDGQIKDLRIVDKRF